MNPFGSLLRAARSLLGLSQAELEALIVMDRKDISRFEAGKYKLISREALRLRNELQKRGVEFVDPQGRSGPGVRWKVPGKADVFRSAQFRAARGLANLSQSELAELAAVDRNFITRLEKDKFNAINPVTQRKVEDALLRLKVEMTGETAEAGAGVRWVEPLGE